jgi:drug/metabolite transporter (DMT)-like permease
VIPLVVSTVFSACFSLVMRFAQGKRCDLIAVGAVNYLTAAAIHWGIALASGTAAASPPSLGIGALGGLAYVTAFFFLYPLMRARGVSVTAAILRISVLVPIAVSVIVWRESTTPIELAGAGLAFASLPLLTLAKSGRGAAAAGGKAGRASPYLLLTGLFIANGLCLLAPRGYAQTGVRGEESAFLGTLFSTAAVVSSGVWVVRALRGGGKPDAEGPRAAAPVTVLSGVALGLCNALANRGTVLALQRLPSIIVFPFYSAVGLALTVIATRVIWNERMNALETAGIVIACAAVVLVNIG